MNECRGDEENDDLKKLKIVSEINFFLKEISVLIFAFNCGLQTVAVEIENRNKACNDKIYRVRAQSGSRSC